MVAQRRSTRLASSVHIVASYDETQRRARPQNCDTETIEQPAVLQVLDTPILSHKTMIRKYQKMRACSKQKVRRSIDSDLNANKTKTVTKSSLYYDKVVSLEKKNADRLTALRILAKRERTVMEVTGNDLLGQIKYHMRRSKRFKDELTAYVSHLTSPADGEVLVQEDKDKSAAWRMPAQVRRVSTAARGVRAQCVRQPCAGGPQLWQT